jgi:hypothetical protein
MNERDEAVVEVRRLIKQGATVPKCLQFICTKLGVDSSGAIDFFRAAFCLSLNAIPKARGGFQRADAENTQRGLATLLVLPMILQNRDKWDEIDSQSSSNWFDLLLCSSSESIAATALASIEGDQNWNNVPAAVKEQYLTAERNRLVLSEYAEIISRLAERLQLRIDQLEQENQAESNSPR